MTLLFGLMLLIGAGILAFSSARTSVVEQRIATNEQQSILAQQAAQAGLEQARAWLGAQVWSPGDAVPSVPDLLAEDGQRFRIELQFSRRTNAICVRSRASSDQEPGLEAIARECFTQTGLFDVDPETRAPPPLVLAGCLAEPLEPGELWRLDEEAAAILSGRAADADCLPQGQLAVGVWSDHNADGVMTPDEKGPSADLERARIVGCPGAQCVWDRVFAMPLDEAKRRAEAAGHVFTDRIPCGATEPPGLYLIRTSGTIDATHLSGFCAEDQGVDDRTIGTPSRPILLIVPSESGCPRFAPDIRVHGIVYYESTSACVGQGWGGARLQGAVLWEGDVQAPALDSVFIETDWGAASALNTAFQVIDGAIRIPGTWRDW
jgi:hypothetical protein